MRFATINEGGRPRIAVVRGDRLLPLAMPEAQFGSLPAIAQSGAEALQRIQGWVQRQVESSYRSLDEVELGPAVPEPGAIYTIGLNYPSPSEAKDVVPDRPLVYAKLPTSVSGHGSAVTWDRSLTANVDPEVELGVIIGRPAVAVAPGEAMRHVFGYTCVNDMSSRDPWLDGDQWLLGKSLDGFCPVGPYVVSRDEVEPARLRLGCTLNGVPIQDGSTAQMRFSIAEVIAYLSHHVMLRPGDLIATGTPARLAEPMGPERHLQAGDVVTAWIEHIGELTTIIV